jgi:hypothetical protein
LKSALFGTDADQKRVTKREREQSDGVVVALERKRQQSGKKRIAEAIDVSLWSDAAAQRAEADAGY